MYTIHAQIAEGGNTYHIKYHHIIHNKWQTLLLFFLNYLGVTNANKLYQILIIYKYGVEIGGEKLKCDDVRKL